MKSEINPKAKSMNPQIAVHEIGRRAAAPAPNDGPDGQILKMTLYLHTLATPICKDTNFRSSITLFSHIITITIKKSYKN